MASVNKVTLLGNLGKDAEVRYTPAGAPVATFSLATTRAWKDKASGERMEETEWHRVVLFDRLAEVAGQYLKKGSPVYVEGRLKTRKWADKNGTDRYTTEVIGGEIQLLGTKPGESGGAAPSQAPAAAPAARRAPQPTSGTGFDNMDDDIPFPF